MKAELISIGDEILIGQIVNTNSVFLAKQLNGIGLEIVQITAISDKKSIIINALDEARKRADIIILTGGLGPTKDDLTKQTLCEYFNDQLVKNEIVLHGQATFINGKQSNGSSLRHVTPNFGHMALRKYFGEYQPKIKLK